MVGTKKQEGVNDMIDLQLCSPRWENQINKWKMVAKMMSTNVTFSEPSDSGLCGDPNYRSKLINEGHFRTAHIRTIQGRETLILGCLVNPSKFDPKELPGLKRMLSEYNARVEEKYGRGRKVVHIREWLDNIQKEV